MLSLFLPLQKKKIFLIKIMYSFPASTSTLCTLECLNIWLLFSHLSFRKTTILICLKHRVSARRTKSKKKKTPLRTWKYKRKRPYQVCLFKQFCRIIFLPCFPHLVKLCWKDPVEEGMATHSSILAWRIPWTEEPDGLESLGSQRVGHSWSHWAQAGFPHSPTLTSIHDYWENRSLD